MRVERVEKVIGALKGLAVAAQGDRDASAVVGYRGVAYAVYVHENMEARHDPGQKAKYLEDPARELNDSGELGRLVTGTMRGGGTLAQGLLVAALRIQRESQQVVPVDTGNLRGSAFTEVENGRV